MKPQCGECTAAVDICRSTAFTGRPFNPEELAERFDAAACDRYFRKLEKEQGVAVCGPVSGPAHWKKLGAGRETSLVKPDKKISTSRDFRDPDGQHAALYHCLRQRRQPGTPFGICAIEEERIHTIECPAHWHTDNRFVGFRCDQPGRAARETGNCDIYTLQVAGLDVGIEFVGIAVAEMIGHHKKRCRIKDAFDLVPVIAASDADLK